MKVSCTQFEHLGEIPHEFTMLGANRVPEFAITDIPEGAAEVVFICHDPDAPLPEGWTHWVLTGITPDSDRKRVLDEKYVAEKSASNLGRNDSGSPLYEGPEPPAGHGTHCYYFTAYALRKTVEEIVDRRTFIQTYGDAVLQQARVVGTYSRESD